MRTDLGTWRGPQAQAVVRALKKAGLSPEAENTVGGTRITVPAAQNDDAHQVLLAAMDDIARAAADGSAPSKRERKRPSAPRRAADDGVPSLVTERLRNLAPLVGLVIALIIAAMIPAGGLRTTVFVFALVAFGIVWSRRNGDDGDDYGPRSR